MMTSNKLWSLKCNLVSCHISLIQSLSHPPWWLFHIFAVSSTSSVHLAVGGWCGGGRDHLSNRNNQKRTSISPYLLICLHLYLLLLWMNCPCACLCQPLHLYSSSHFPSFIKKITAVILPSVKKNPSFNYTLSTTIAFSHNKTTRKIYYM